MESNPTDSDSVAVVRRFGAAWDRLDLDAVIALIAPDAIYHNMPLEPLHGRPAIADYLRRAGPFDACRWEFLTIAAAGNVVLTERVDHLSVAGKAVVLPVMGSFEIMDGLIRRWRDYFDLASYRAQWPSREVQA